MDKILVTGGLGFIGSHVATALVDAGHKVRIADNYATGTEQNLPAGVRQSPLLEIVRVDLRNWKAVHQVVEGVDHCIHLAGQSSVPLSMENPRVSFETNLLGFVNLVDGLRQQVFTGRLVYASDASVYGNVLKHRPLAEEASKEATFTSPYSLEKQEVERMAELHRKLFGLQAVGLRLFNVYGKRQPRSGAYANVVSVFEEKLAANQMLPVCGDGHQTRDFIHVDDVVAIMLRFLKNDSTGVFNLGTGEGTSVKELARTMGKLMGVEPQMMHTAERPGDLRHSCAELSHLRSVIGDYTFADLRTGLMKTLKNSL